MSAMEKAQTADPGILWRQKWINIGDMSWGRGASLFPDGGRGSPVHLRGEDPHDGGDPVNADDVSDGLKHVKVEEGLPRHRAVQPGLHERCPVLLQHPLRPADVVLANPGDAGIHNLAAEEGGSYNTLAC